MLMLERQVEEIFNLGSIIIIAIINIILLLVAINNIKLMLENDTYIKSHPDYPNFGSRIRDLLNTQFLFSFAKSKKNQFFLTNFLCRPPKKLAACHTVNFNANVLPHSLFEALYPNFPWVPLELHYSHELYFG